MSRKCHSEPGDTVTARWKSWEGGRLRHDRSAATLGGDTVRLHKSFADELERDSACGDRRPPHASPCHRSQIVQLELSGLFGALQHVDDTGMNALEFSAPPHERQ